MAKVSILGGSYVLVSKYPLASLKLIEKRRPKALLEIDHETKEPLFKVATGAMGSVSGNGVVFNGTSNTDEKLACVTLSIPEGVEDAKAYVADKVGSALIALNKIEARLDRVFDDIQTEESSINECIQIKE